MTSKEEIRNIIEIFIAWNGETDVIDIANIDSAVDFISNCLQKEPVSEDLDKAAEEWDESLYRSDAFKAGAKWQKEQFDKKVKEAFCKARCNSHPPRSTCTSLGTCKEYDNFVKLLKGE